jgi:predicted porin
MTFIGGVEYMKNAHQPNRYAKLPTPVALAIALGFSAPALAESDLETLKRQVAQQQKTIERLEAQANQAQANQAAAKAAAPEPGAASGRVENPVAGKMAVEFYGTVIPFAESISGSGATSTVPAERPNMIGAGAYTGTNQSSRLRLTAGTSNLGFRGAMPFADGWKAIWQIETGVAVDGDSGGIANSNSLGVRNTHVGVASPYGTMFVGNWDTPYKWISMATVPLKGVNAFDYTVLIGNPGLGVPGTTTQFGRASAGKGDAAFDRRQGNSLQYWTPNLGGFSGRVGYSFDEGKSGSTAAAEISPSIWSLSAGYANNGFSLQYAYEQHNDYFGLSPIGGAAASASNSSSRDSGHKLVGIYTIGATKLTAIVEQLRYRNDDSGNAANVDEYKRNAFVVGIQQQFGPGKAWLNFGKASDGSCSTVGGITCNTDGMGAKYWNLGYVHSVHKLVDLFASYYNIDNEESGTYQPTFMLNVAPGATPAPGLGIRGFGVGAVMAF